MNWTTSSRERYNSHEQKNQINIAKQKALNLYDAGYTKPIERNDIKVLGKQALGMLYVGVDSLRAGIISPIMIKK